MSSISMAWALNKQIVMRLFTNNKCGSCVVSQKGLNFQVACCCRLERRFRELESRAGSDRQTAHNRLAQALRDSAELRFGDLASFLPGILMAQNVACKANCDMSTKDCLNVVRRNA